MIFKFEEITKLQKRVVYVILGFIACCFDGSDLN